MIKDGCKVAGFVGGVIISGGAAGVASAGVVTQGTLVVTGSDMILEVADDAANIGLGDSNKVSAIVGSVRAYTEPAATLLSLRDVAKNLASNAPTAAERGMNVANAVMFEAEQIRSIAQDEKILGISFADSAENEKARQAFAAQLKKNEIKPWIEEQTKERAVADSLDDLAGEIEDRTVADSLDDLQNELEYEDFIKGYVEQQKAEFAAEQKQINDEADARIEEAQAELEKSIAEDALEEESESEKTEETNGSIVDSYINEMHGQPMDDLQTYFQYEYKFEELKANGAITLEEHDALMVEANRIAEKQRQEKSKKKN